MAKAEGMHRRLRGVPWGSGLGASRPLSLRLLACEFSDSSDSCRAGAQEPATFSDVERDILEQGAHEGPVHSPATLERWYREFQGRLEDVGAHRPRLPHTGPSRRSSRQSP